jgi:Flp pilus assembly pilin Flp
MNKGKREKLLNNKQGQGVMEYLIITSLIGILCLSVVSDFGGALKNRIRNMKEYINQSIKKQSID